MQLDALDASALDRPANANWFVTGRASQRYRFRRCLALLCRHRNHFGTALDIGCARGDFTRELASFCGRVTGIDASPGIIDAARSTADLPNVEFHCCRFPSSQFPSHSFDLISALEVLYYFEDRQADVFFSEACRLLASGGVLLLSVNAYGDTMAGAENIRRRVSRDFRIVASELIYREIYYRLELSLIRLLEDIHYFRLWQPFGLRESTPGLVTPLLRHFAVTCPSLLSPPLLRLLESTSRRMLDSDLLFAAIERLNRCAGPARGRNQLVIVAVAA